MTDYEQGFLEALSAVCHMGSVKHKYHFDNAQNESLSKEDQEMALNCSIVLGQFVSDIKNLGSEIYRKEINPTLIAKANAPLWWATKDGKGAS